VFTSSNWSQYATREFVSFVASVPTSHCHKITVLFTAADEAIHFSTCGRQLCVPERVEWEEPFVARDELHNFMNILTS